MQAKWIKLGLEKVYVHTQYFLHYNRNTFVVPSGFIGEDRIVVVRRWDSFLELVWSGQSQTDPPISVNLSDTASYTRVMVISHHRIHGAIQDS